MSSATLSSVPESQVVVPEAPLATTTGDTPIGRAAEAAVGVRGAGKGRLAAPDPVPES